MSSNKLWLPLVGLLIIILTSCDIVDFNSDNPKVRNLQSQISDDIQAVDVVQKNDRIFILGQENTYRNNMDNFYLAEINEKGSLVWEKTYGTDSDETPHTMTVTSDGHLLLVGSTGTDEFLFAVKTDFNGELLWRNTYKFDPDKVGFGNYVGRSVTEVNKGYIIGGSGTLSDHQTGIGVAALTKIAPDGNKVWSKAANYSNAGDSFYGVQSRADGTQFIATGSIQGADYVIYDAITADTVQIINHTHSNDYYLDLAKVEDNYFSPNGNSNRLELLGISSNFSTIYGYIRNDFDIYGPTNINSFSESIITTGATYIDQTFKDKNIFAIKNSTNLSTIWTFYHSSETPQIAVGAYQLTNGQTGIVANQFDEKQSNIILLKLNSRGNLIDF